jgi:hypothetical protein
MIVMVEEGRLGNQVFQYAALRTACRPNERLWLLGFDQLRETFTGIDARFSHIASNPLKHLVTLNYDRVRTLSRFVPMTGMVNESTESMVVRQPSRVSISQPAWYQTDAYANSEAVRRLRVREDHLERAQAVLEANGLSGARTAFVHVRAGDYRQWPTAEAPAILSPEWYRAQIMRLRESDSTVAVIGIGDEPEYVAEVMSSVPNGFTAREDYATEFALMSLCASGILSASSFAYWGAVFARRTFPNGTYIAPRFWAGHATQSWYPPNIQTNSLSYVDVVG